MRKILIIFLMISFFTSIGFCEEDFTFYVNEKSVHRNEKVLLFGKDLIEKKIIFKFPFISTLKKVELTLDKGKSWIVMQKKEDFFVYEYFPKRKEEELFPEFLLTFSDGTMKSFTPYIRIIYQKYTPEEMIVKILDKMKFYYEHENIYRFMDLFSSNFPERIKFKEAIQNDFYHYHDIRMHYRIDKKIFDTYYQNAIWDVKWEIKAKDRKEREVNLSALIKMKFKKENGDWKIVFLRNNTIFGSSFLSKPDLKVSSSDITISPQGMNTQVSVVVHNIGKKTAYDVKVEIYYRMKGSYHWVLFGAQTIDKINAYSTFTVSSTDYIASGYTYEFKVVVDADNTIDEEDETNNQATKRKTI